MFTFWRMCITAAYICFCNRCLMYIAVLQAYARTQFALTNGCTHSTLAEAQLRMAAWDARMSESLVQSGKNGRWDVWSQKAPS